MPHRRLSLIALFLTACGGGENQGLAESGATHEPSVGTITEAIDKQRSQLVATAAEGDEETAYQFVFEGLLLDEIPLSAFRGRPVLVVNTASQCGFTPQYAGLQELHETYEDRGLVVLGVPSNDFGGQEPGSEEQIEEFCRLNYGVSFPMTAKYSVQGSNAHPFFAWAREELGRSAIPSWNFHKILIGPDGRAATTFPSSVTPTSHQLVSALDELLAETTMEAQ